ncbi:acyl-CoA dehydrogenase family protein [Fodinicola feengrottensis]|uniref:acyl-CoA dehydrogenase family protein n=1 Tax=Fodinicola feengrottensis TaxID=435914 RepID=UPI0013D49490|nr:acyl-CoA dehydrogenase family protein [Fodinicola feengrottensis]
MALDVDDGTGTASATIVGIPDLRWATHAVLPLAGSDRVAVIDLDDDRASAVALDSLDATRPVGTLRLDRCPVELVVNPARASAVMSYLAALACEALGVGRTALALGVEHAGTRVQFGKPLGVYQGVSHRLAHTFQNLELARSLSYRAAWSVDAHPTLSAVDRALIAGAALRAGAMAVEACEDTLQVLLGGIGMTWDHPLHRWYKRAVSSYGVAAQLVNDSKALDGLGDGTIPIAA